MNAFSKFLAYGALVTSVAGITACTTLEPDNFDRVDEDGDGQLSLRELENALAESLFTSGDLNGDGVVTFAEWKEVLPTTNQARFFKYAPDGKMTLEQARQAVDEGGVFDSLLGSIDTNNNGIVDKEEARIFHDAMEAADGDNDVQRLNAILTKSQDI